jgi:uncharacterized protein YbaP (TraB family)
MTLRLANMLMVAALAATAAATAFAQAPIDCPPVAQAPSPEQANAARQAARDHGFLWRIRKDGHASYLYGTVHVGRLAWIFPGPTVAAAFAKADTLALEMDPLDPQIQQGMAQGLAAQTGDTDTLPDALQQRLDRDIQAECLPAQTIAMLSPQMKALTLTTLAGRRDGLDPGYGIDIALAALNHAAGKPTISLETPELQLAALQTLSTEDTLAFVESTLDDLESGRARPTLLRIAQVWADSDWASLENYASWCACLDTPADKLAMTRLLDERNPGLANGIAALHESGKDVFAAVGSLHMIGPLGLPAQLARRGFAVERVALVTAPPR